MGVAGLLPQPYWFLIATFWVFAVIAWVDTRGWLDDLRVVITAIVVVGLVDVVVPAQDRSYEFLSLRSALFLSTFFLTGLAAARFNWSRARARWKWLVGIAALMLFGLTQLGLFGVIPRVHNRNEIIGTALGVLGCLALLSLNMRSSLLARIGAYSAGIFLVHSFVIAGVRAVLRRSGVESIEVLFAAGLMFGIVGSIAIIMVLRKVAPGRLILGESARRPAREAVRAL